MLTTSEGEVFVSSLERGVRLGVGLHGEAAKARAALDSAPLLHALREGDLPSGVIRVGADLYVFARLESVPWALVVRLDPRAALP